MNRLFAGIAVTIMVLSLTANAQWGDYDASFTVKAYALSEAQEAEYWQDDWRLTKFWGAWEADGANLDEVVLTGENCAWGECSPVPGNDDVTYKIRFAYGERGVYVLHEITDDNWQGNCRLNLYENDGVKFMTDAHSASELYKDQAALFIDSRYEITKSFTQIQIIFGGENPIEEFVLSTPKPEATVGGSYEGHKEFMDHDPIHIAGTNEVLIKVLYFNATPTVRRQEWLVPWGIWGGDGVGPQEEGDKLAVTFGYNDLDGCGFDLWPHALRWRNNTDPYIDTAAGAWGDVEFAGALSSTVPISILEHFPRHGGPLPPMKVDATTPVEIQRRGASLVISNLLPGTTLPVQLWDARGRAVFHQMFTTTGLPVHIPCASFPRGVYVIRVQIPGQTVTQTLSMPR